jgi:hypothetical protein
MRSNILNGCLKLLREPLLRHNFLVDHQNCIFVESDQTADELRSVTTGFAALALFCDPVHFIGAAL